MARVPDRPGKSNDRGAAGNKAGTRFIVAGQRSCMNACRSAALVCNDVLCPFAHTAVLVEPLIAKIIKEFGRTTGK
jgi:hypothetical protein